MAKSSIVCMQHTLKILRILGIFPEKGSELNPGYFYYIKFGILLFICSVPLLGSLLHLIQSLRAGVFINLVSDLTYILSLGATSIFGLSFVLKSEALAEVFLFLSDFKEFGKPVDFDKENQFYTKFSICHYIYLETLIISLFIFSAIYNTSICNKNNAMYDLDEICGLVAYTWMPFGINYNPVKQFFLVVQAFGMHHMYVIAGMCSWSVLETIEHIRIRIRHVNNLFQEAVAEMDPEIAKEKFSNAVRYHSSLFSFEDKINGAFGTFMFTHMAITAPIIGTGLFAFLSEGAINLFIIALGWIGGLALDCLAGQWLQDECFALGYDLYQADWFHCSDDLKKDIMFVILRSTKPMLLRASYFGIMDYRMFLGVMKGSYSYITLLTQT